MRGWTYILECSDGSFYVGSTINLENRVHQHNEGTGARYTAARRPVALMWAAEFDSIRDAFWFEKQVQNWSRAKREALIEGRFDDLPELARAHMHRMARPPVVEQRPEQLDSGGSLRRDH
jgi:putative endonuclease